MPNFSNKSQQRLLECDHRLQLLFDTIIKYRDCTIITGHRNEEEQNKRYYAVPQLSRVKYPNGKHNTIPSKAVDASPWPIPKNWGEDHWKDKAIFYEFAGVVKYEAVRLGIKIRWGGDWDSDGDYTDQKFDDLIHFELVD